MVPLALPLQADFTCFQNIQLYLSADLQVFFSKVHGLVVVPQSGVSVSQTPACTPLANPTAKLVHLSTGQTSDSTDSPTLNVCVPVIEVLRYNEVFEMVVYGSLIVLEKGVGVPQTVAGLSLHGSILQLPRQLQRPPETQTAWRFLFILNSQIKPAVVREQRHA